MRSTKIIKICSSSLCTCLHHMVILRTRNKITDFLMILAWASPFKRRIGLRLRLCAPPPPNTPLQKGHYRSKCQKWPKDRFQYGVQTGHCNQDLSYVIALPAKLSYLISLILTLTTLKKIVKNHEEPNVSFSI